MLKRLSTREILRNLAVEWEQTISLAWLEAIQDITSDVVLKRLVAELERGPAGIDDALRMLDIDADRFARFEGAILQAYNAGGQSVVSNMPRLSDPMGNRVHFAWGARNTPAENILRQHAAALVNDLVGEQLNIARTILSEGLASGQNPYQTARKLVGPINARTKLREGGVLGLSQAAKETLDRYYLGLRSGDAQIMREYRRLKLRDVRLDGHVDGALASGGSVPEEAVDRILRAYSNRALKKRADNIALAETNTAIATAKNSAFQQQIDSGKLLASDLTKTWVRTISRVPRPDHLELAGQTVPFDQPFIAADGTMIMFPHAPGLPARHRVGCKCGCREEINFTAQAVRQYRARIGG